MDVSLVVTDLDGTFWSRDLTLHAHTERAVRAIDDAGLPFAIATGRRPQSAHAGLAPLGHASRPAILMNGALSRDRLDGESFHRVHVADSAVDVVLDTFHEAGLEPLVYIDDASRDLLAGPDAAAGRSFLDRAPGVRRVSDLRDAVREHIVIGFGAFGYPRDLLARIQSSINETGVVTALINVSHLEGDHGIMVQATAADKAIAVSRYCERHGIDERGVVAIGDGYNDVEMLRSAGIAVVPSNAPDDVQALADVIIAPNEEGGWDAVPDIVGL